MSNAISPPNPPKDIRRPSTAAQPAGLPHVVLAGRPNVGKSTLFNRLIRAKRAITHDRPGVTRDRMEGIVRRNGLPAYAVMDTGGVTLDAHAAVAEGPESLRGFEADILRQTEAALAAAAGVALVVDGRDGLLPLDEHLAAYLRRTGLPSLCIVNKVDGIEREDELTAEFHALGLPLVAVSAEHGHNMPLLAEMLAELARREDAPGEAVSPPKTALRLAMLGRPNAGKSSLVNALTGEERMIVSSIAGTTRDSVDVRFARKEREYVFVDTAGVRRRAKITDSLEKYSVNSSLKSASKADVTLLVLDAAQGVSQQDKRLVDLLGTRKIPFLILINKCDLAPRAALKQLEKNVRAMLSFCAHVPVLPVSAKTGQNLEEIMRLAEKIHAECHIRVPTGQLNRAMEEVLAKHQPPVVKRARAKFYYLTQAETAPPTFVFFVSDAERVPENYARYLERALRALFGIAHAPIRLHLRSSHKKKQ
ncbi:MAG: ribosome biogenesis GTPase Der [Desulfovibrio sp.]|nr:ribosome biogenesis GTPase Der [Desulfovibrio sp.]